MSLQVIFYILLIFWLFALSLIFYWILKHYLGLVKGVGGGNLKQILDKVLDVERKNEKVLGDLAKEIKRLELEGSYHIQKLGLVRFNPFKETGGDHSFSVALLDAKQSGLVITGLHTRDRTRVYVKRIKDGKSSYELSYEEKKAMEEALKS